MNEIPLTLGLGTGEASDPVDERKTVFFNRQILKGYLSRSGKLRDCFIICGQFQIQNVGIMKGDEVTHVFSHLFSILPKFK